MQINESLIRSVVAQVLAEVGRGANVAPKSSAGRYGIFTCVNEAGYVSVDVKRNREDLVESFEAALSGWIDLDDKPDTIEGWITLAENADFKPEISEHTL